TVEWATLLCPAVLGTRRQCFRPERAAQPADWPVCLECRCLARTDGVAPSLLLCLCGSGSWMHGAQSARDTQSRRRSRPFLLAGRLFRCIVTSALPSASPSESRLITWDTGCSVVGPETLSGLAPREAVCNVSASLCFGDLCSLASASLTEPCSLVNASLTIAS